ncbi:MAG: bifunctional serine/threonine-protein kinase/formylglycine-generating enzyme family protein [Verrucomicrobiota bacterium]|nr:bifunctional serine/threonine-protein kinase/formylglycine-generating enzyme family protein [Verrucomicrobiota bacterium]
MTDQAPDIPDHVIIRRIGKGSYGEVWLGRSVTGALRAVKVVTRADFDLDHTFEREFEGIKSFEKVSLKHPGLVNILHVGRNDKEGFYYYVMELADDRASGRDIDPEQYVPHTLSSEINKQGRLPMDRCAVWCEVLAGALHHMHCNGLAHRDVKPSNVVFCDGVPKLADMGLVAASGQKTFVGTEGFSPPEGPGEPAADIYSLGKVLYEMSTGHDRLDFPTFSSFKRDAAEKRKWHGVNAIFLKACEGLVKNRYGNAREMRQALRDIGSGGAVALSLPSRIFRVALFSGILALITVAGRNHDLIKAYFSAGNVVPQPMPVEVEPIDDSAEPDAGQVTLPPAEKFGSVKIKSFPTGAKVYQIIDGGGRAFRGYTSPDYVEAEVLPGEVAFIIELAGYRYSEVSGFVVAGETLNLDAGKLEFYRPPLPGEEWRNSMGMLFDSDGNRHVARRPFTPQEFERFLKGQTGIVDFQRVSVTPEGENDAYQTVMVNRKRAREFFDWLTAQEKRSGHLAEDQYYALNNDAEYRQDGGNSSSGSGTDGERFALFSSVQEVDFSRLLISSKPPGAGVYIDGEFLGTTEIEIPERYPGVLDVAIRLAGFKQELVTIELEPGKTHELAVILREDNSVVLNRKWVNGMGMALLPLGEGVMMAEHETRVQDFDAFCEDKGITPLVRPDFNQGAGHPVVKVSRKDAMAFCEWLSLKEREEELIDADHEYRLPTDREWSIAAGLGREQGEAPWQRDLSVKGVFPWGDQWPLFKGSANIADQSARQWLPEGRVLSGYDDKYAYTAPVGSFKPNAGGYFDMAGNVWEWVLDPYGGREGDRFRDGAVARGGGYDAAAKELFFTSYRNVQAAGAPSTAIGFRIVLAISGINLKD